jgi:hypothetical protein
MHTTMAARGVSLEDDFCAILYHRRIKIKPEIRSHPQRTALSVQSCASDQYLAVLFDRAGTDCGTETDGPVAARKSRSHRCQSAKNCDGDRRNAKRSQSRRNC